AQHVAGGERRLGDLLPAVRRSCHLLLLPEPEEVIAVESNKGEMSMKSKLLAAVAGIALAMSAGAALADGELQIFNWGDYTNPDLIKKFEETYNVKVTV